MSRVTAGMRLRRAYVFVSRQFLNTCDSSGARNTMARLFVFIVILVIFSQCYLAGSPSRVTFKRRKVMRAIEAEDAICEGCRRIVEEHRRTGNSFQHVSAISSYY